MSTMYAVLSKLDGRHAGTQYFKYRAEIRGTREDRVQGFVDVRDWCYQTWGSGTEREFAHIVKCAHWGWHTGRDILFDPLYIYLVDDQDAALFKLKWI